MLIFIPNQRQENIQAYNNVVNNWINALPSLENFEITINDPDTNLGAAFGQSTITEDKEIPKSLPGDDFSSYKSLRFTTKLLVLKNAFWDPSKAGSFIFTISNGSQTTILNFTNQIDLFAFADVCCDVNCNSYCKGYLVIYSKCYVYDFENLQFDFNRGCVGGYTGKILPMSLFEIYLTQPFNVTQVISITIRDSRDPFLAIPQIIGDYSNSW